MKRTPLITLLAGLALGAVLLGMNLAASGEADLEPGNLAAATPTAAASEAATPDASPSPAAKVNAVWAGEVDGGGATIAIAVNDGVAVAYLCDGNRAEVWLQGSAADGKLTLTGANDAKLAGTFGNGKAKGKVTAAGTSWRFTAPAVSKPSGLYRAVADVRNAKVVGGWIILPDGTQVGILTIDGEPAPAPALDLVSGTATVDGVTITAAPVAGSLQK